MLGNPVRTQRKVGKSAQIPGRKEGRELIPQGLSFSLPLIPCPSLHLPPAGKPSQRNSKDDSIILIPALCGLQGECASSELASHSVETGVLTLWDHPTAKPHISARRAREEGRFRTSPVPQWIRICLQMQGTWVCSLAREDPTCCRGTKPRHHTTEFTRLEPALGNKRAMRGSRASAKRNPPPPPHPHPTHFAATGESPSKATETQHSQKSVNKRESFRRRSPGTCQPHCCRWHRPCCP